MKAELWQHPFVDIFKLVNLSEWRIGQKEGDVSETTDRTIGKKVYKISGQISAANYIQIPRAKSLLKTLGLTGQYIYIQLLQYPEKFFSIHLEFAINNSKTDINEPLRLTLSNIYKETKLTSGGLQISCHLSQKWTTLILDVKSLIKYFIGPHIIGHMLKCITICSSVLIKNLYSSDILYDSSSIPKEMAFKIPKDQSYDSVYDWGFLTADVVETQEIPTESQDLEEIIEEVKEELPEPVPEKIETPKPKEPEKIIPKIEPKIEAKPAPVAKPVEKPAVKQDLMQPDPLMSLSHIIGYSGLSARTVKWTKPQSNFTVYPKEFTQGSSKYIMYPSGCSLILMNPVNRKQHFLFGHTAPITSLAISQNGSIIVSGQSSPPQALVWEIKIMRAPIFLSSPKLKSLTSVDVSHDNKHVAISGFDEKGREVIIIWDISGISTGKSPEIKARQVSNFNILTLKFSPVDNERLVTCGKESIRIWKINKDHLNGKAVVLSHHARSSEFLDLAFDIPPQGTDDYFRRIFVVSNQGMLFQINYESAELEGVLQLHDSGINSITVAEGYCVTGSDDCFLRVWPLDFSEYLLEARHEGPVISVDISLDKYSIVCGTGNCTIGSLDISTNAYRTLLRSHTAPILAIDIHPVNGLILTTSEDKTLRIWSPEHFEEQFEFFSPQDLPLTVSFHPCQNIFACGFESGALRIFEIETTSMREEFLQHECKIVKCVHSLDGKFLLSASEDGVVCLYDSIRKYQPVKTIPVEVLGDKVDVCFSYDSKQFAVLGTYNSMIFIWDIQTFSQKFRINTPGFMIKKMIFAPNGQDLLVISHGQDYRVKFYGLNGFEAIFIKEFLSCHQSSEISEISISQNSKYLVTGSVDKIIKIWDYAARPKSLRSQGFIGHNYTVSHIRFSLDRKYLISCALGADGIFIWKFNGDTSNSSTPYGLN